MQTSFPQVDKIIAGDQEEIQSLAKDLRLKGWSFVQLPESIVKQTTELIAPLEQFFQSPQELKLKYQKDKLWGYNSVNHKQGLRYMTGARLDNNLMPLEQRQQIETLIKTMDTLMVQFMQQTSKTLFTSTPEEIGENYDIPLLKDRKTEKDFFGMFDIVQYYNNKTANPSDATLIQKNDPSVLNTDHMNCVPHADPGLLSLSILSTTEGLELQDPKTNEWFRPPSDPTIGVIWCGEAARTISHGVVLPGIHRVSFPDTSKSRLTMWFEICIRSQDLKAYTTEPSFFGKIMSFFTGKPQLRATNVPNKPIVSGENNVDAFLTLENNYGMSASKSEYLPEPGEPIASLMKKERKTGVPPTKSKRPPQINKLMKNENDLGVPPTKDLSLELLHVNENDLGIPPTKSLEL